MTAEILLARRSRGDGDLGAPEEVAEARFGVGGGFITRRVPRGRGALQRRRTLRGGGAESVAPDGEERVLPLPYPTPSLFPREKYIKKDAREPLALERAAAKRANRRSDR